jgi:hypothetical protein
MSTPICICLTGGVEVHVMRMVVIGRIEGVPALVRFLDSTGTPYQVRVEKLRLDGRRLTPEEIESKSIAKEVQAS